MSEESVKLEEMQANNPFLEYMKSKGNAVSESVEEDNAEDRQEVEAEAEEGEEEEKAEEEAEESEDIKGMRESIENTRKAAGETWRALRVAQNKIKDVTKRLKELVEEGTIEEDKAEELAALLKLDKVRIHVDDSAVGKQETDPLDAFTEQVDEGVIEAYKELMDDEDGFETKVRMFRIFWHHEGSAEEKEELLEDLKTAKTPLAVLKKMLGAGERFSESTPGMKDYLSAGGARNFLKKVQAEKEILQKEVDKLKKRLQDKQSVTKPSSVLFKSSGSSAHEEGPSKELNAYQAYRLGKQAGR